MRPEVAERRIKAFRRKFGEPHLILACHAAFPLALTPDLLYRIWANFREDIYGNPLEIPWIAVSDLLLSNLCEEVGFELYEINNHIRTRLLITLELLAGEKRINELSYFVLNYISGISNRLDPQISSFIEAQSWVALAYVEPNQMARKVALYLKSAYNNSNKSEFIRTARLLETVAIPLVKAGLRPLLLYSIGMAEYFCGNKDRRLFDEFTKAIVQEREQHPLFRELELLVPNDLEEYTEDLSLNEIPPKTTEEPEYFRDILVSYGISQAELSRKSGVSAGTISKICNGRRCPSPATKRKIVATLNNLTNRDDLANIIFPGEIGDLFTLRTKITDEVILQQALRNLGFTVKTDADVRGSNGQRVRADVVAVLEGDYDLGWSKNPDHSYDLIADLWGVAKKHDHTQLINSINQRYAVLKALPEVKRPTTTPVCPRCDSRQVVKSHFIHGERYYICRNCGNNFTGPF